MNFVIGKYGKMVNYRKMSDRIVLEMETMNKNDEIKMLRIIF